MKKSIISSALVLLVASCATTGALQPSQADVSSERLKDKNITLQQLESGYHLYVQNCASCHKLHAPGEYTVAEWNKILPEMYTKAHLQDEEEKKRLIGVYLVSKAK